VNTSATASATAFLLPLILGLSTLGFIFSAVIAMSPTAAEIIEEAALMQRISATPRYDRYGQPGGAPQQAAAPQPYATGSQPTAAGPRPYLTGSQPAASQPAAGARPAAGSQPAIGARPAAGESQPAAEPGSLFRPARRDRNQS
jgi:hypothetical protein